MKINFEKKPDNGFICYFHKGGKVLVIINVPKWHVWHFTIDGTCVWDKQLYEESKERLLEEIAACYLEFGPIKGKGYKINGYPELQHLL